MRYLQRTTGRPRPDFLYARGPGGAVGRALLAGLLLGGWATSRADFILDETEEMPTTRKETEEALTPYEADEILPIGLIQSPVTGDDEGVQHRSPFEGKEVMVRGVVHARILLKRAEDRRGYGFYLQNTQDTADRDPDTSDGLFVWTGSDRTLPADVGDFTPRVGDDLVLKGTVREVNGLTQLGSPHVVRVVRRDVAVDEVLPAFDVDPPDTADEAGRYWERREGMRCTVPAGCVLTSGRKVFDRTAEAEVWAMHPGRLPARRTEPYQRRVFRDAHPLDDRPDTLFDNENGYRFRIGSLGLKGASGQPDIMLGLLRTFDVTTLPAVGVAHQAYERYSVEVSAPLQFERSVNPYGNGRPTTRLSRARHFTIGTFNVENLYDLRNDPYDDYDFRDDPGGPGVRKPFNYVPGDLSTYRAKLRTLAVQIVRSMQSPDIVMIQEIEDQDIAVADGDALEVPGRDNADGLPDALQELVVAIRHAGGPAYAAANDRDGADVRGIVCAFLYDPLRVKRVRPDTDHLVLGRDLDLDYRGVPLAYNRDVQNPKAVNAVLPSDVDTSTGMSSTNVFSRAMQVALFEVFPGSGREDEAVPIYLLNNHFSSRPDQRVGQRKEQAAMNAALAQRILDDQPGAYLVMGGDLNVYPRPDDPFAEPSDQLAALYQAGLWNVFSYLLENTPAAAYTYVYQGQAQTLDQLFLSPALRRRLKLAWVPHVNSDWPAGTTTSGRFGASDHEPVVAAFRF